MAADGAAPAIEAHRPAAMAPTAACRGADLAIGALVAFLECAAIVSAPGVGVAIVTHTLSVAALGYWLARSLRSGADGSVPALMLIATAAAGPIGTLGALVAAQVAARASRREEPELLRDWYERISHSVAVDPVTRLCEQVSAGRSISLSEEPPVSFWSVLDGGPIDQQQAVLGLIGRRFDPRFLPILAQALESPVAVVRVQAAAVAARVRYRIETRARELVAEAKADEVRADRAVAVAAELELYARSGLCDQLVREEAARLVDTLLSRHRIGIERELWAPARSGARADPAFEERRRLLERYLVRSGDFATLRRLRSRRRIADLDRHARVRALPAKTKRAATPWSRP